MALTRRSFLNAGLLGMPCSLRLAAAQRSSATGPPPVVKPRATAGDERFEPDWSERLVIGVGVKGGEIVDSYEKAIQAAVDHAAPHGAGTVQVLPGTYTLRNAIYLPSGVRIVGAGEETVITKVASVSTPLAADSDWHDQEVTLQEACGFRVGDGIVLSARDPHSGSRIVIKGTLLARAANRFKLNDGPGKNPWLDCDPKASLLFPLLTAERAADITIEKLRLDGNRANNENRNGNYGGCIFLQDCNRIVIRNVMARNYNGDGISCQVCYDVLIDGCCCVVNADLGVHPGSQRPILRQSLMERNRVGLFWCWGVKLGLAEHNRIRHNDHYSILIGQNETDNVMREKEIVGSGRVGILFRDERGGVDFWPNRNRLEGNRIIDSGEQGTAIDIRGKSRYLKKDSRQPAPRDTWPG